MEKYNVIIDCDTGIDDSIALILALMSDEINVVGISVVGGNTSLDKAYINTKRILHLLGKDAPVVKGHPKPFYRDLDLAEDTHGDDGFGGIGRSFDQEYNFQIKDDQEIGLEDFYSSALDKYDDLNIIAIGPMTNIYSILKTMPEKFDRVSRLISMGGSYKSHGNSSPVAEFNYWVDPEGADYVYQNSPVKVEMVGLDVTRKVVLEDERMAELKESNRDIADFIEKLTGFYYDFHMKQEGLYGCVINDPLAIACLLDDDLLKGFEAYTEIASADKARGASIVDDHNFYSRDPNSIVYTQVDVDRFFAILNAAIGVE